MSSVVATKHGRQSSWLLLLSARVVRFFSVPSKRIVQSADTVQLGLKFDNTYAWCMRFDKDGIIVEVRAYLDSWMVKQAIEENEAPSRRAALPTFEHDQ